MNKINFYSGDKFPMFRDALAKMQDMINAVAGLALLGGKNYVLSGCIEDSKGDVSDGYVVIGGELLPFIGGSKANKVVIKELREPVMAFGVTYPEVYITRTVEFSNNGDIDWTLFEHIPASMDLFRLIKDIKGDAPGTVKMWAGQISKIPTDYKLCDGAYLSTKDFPVLYDIIGINFGGDGQSSFRLPDLRGRFIVGFDGSVDSDYNVIGKKGGVKEVALTKDQLPSHNHSDNKYFNKLSARAADVDAKNTPSGLDENTPQAEYRVGGMSDTQWEDAQIKTVGENKPHENRPPFFTLAYIIKVQ